MMPRERPATPEGILVVDDDQDIREALGSILEERGYRVAEAANGLESLNYLRSASPLPGLILLDLMMPVMDGWQFCTERTKYPTLALIPVVIMTAASNSRVKSPIPGATLLQKPIRLETLIETVRQCCGDFGEVQPSLRS